MNLVPVSAEEIERVKNCTCPWCQAFRRSNNLPLVKKKK